MNALWQDLRYGARMLARKPGFTIAAVTTLALGIGANTAVFSVVRAVLLRPLPYRQPEQLVMLDLTRAGSASHVPVSPAIFLDWRARQGVFADLAAYEDAAISNRPRFYLSDGSEPERIWGARITTNLCGILGVRAALGRTFLPDEEGPENGQVALISDGLWRRRFGADPKLPGKTIKLNDRPYTIVGVMPPDFKLSYPQATDLWTPITFGPRDRNNRREIAYRVIGRLKAGVTIDQARRGMESLAHALGEEHPAEKDFGVRIAGLHEELFGSMKLPLLILVAAVGLVLLIACVNVINLVLAQSSDRAVELSVRAALGARPGRLAKQLLTESLLLSLFGGVVGLLLALLGRDLMVKLMPSTIPRSNEVAIDGWVLGFTFLLSLAAGVSCGLMPAWRASTLGFCDALKAGVNSALAGLRARRLRSALIIAEIALALMLLVGSGLMIRSLWRLQQVALGFQPANILTMQFTVPVFKHWSDEQDAQFVLRVLERVKAVPGVLAAASTSSVPLRGVDYVSQFSIPDRPEPSSSPRPVARWRVVSADYFRVMGVRLLKGRVFTEQDTNSSAHVALISETMARQFFAEAEPLGKHLIINRRDSEIVGVVGDVNQNSLYKPIEPALYECLSQTSIDPACLVVRTSGNPLALTAAMQQAVWAEEREQPIENVSTMERIVAAATAETGFYARVLMIFALVALSLAALGIYGVMSYSVAQRKHELGIRIALGAAPRDVLRLVVGQGFFLTVIGVAIGLGAAFALTRLMSSLLFGVSATDPATFALIAVLLSGVAMLASWLPARRATKVDPIVALRSE